MNENDRFRKIIKELRLTYNLTQANIQELTNLPSNKYSRIEKGLQNSDLDDLKSISQVYGLQPYEILNPKLIFPKLEKLPKATRKLSLINRPNLLKEKGDWNIPSKIIEVLKLYTSKDTFVNSEIIEKLSNDLSEHIKGKSIEWNKGSLKGLVEKTGIKRRNINNTNSEGGLEIEYRLIKESKN